jgi:hypothetical protein
VIASVLATDELAVDVRRVAMVAGRAEVGQQGRPRLLLSHAARQPTNDHRRDTATTKTGHATNANEARSTKYELRLPLVSTNAI